MLLHHGVDDFPEAIGKTIACGGCNKHLQLPECISIVYLQQIAEGKQQVQMSLVCMECVVTKLEPMGKC
jgi:hypothetical protein